MAVGLESHRSTVRVRADPQDQHHHQSHHWWHWRHKKVPQPQQQPTHEATDHRRVHHHHRQRRDAQPRDTTDALALASKPHALSKRLSSATSFHDDPQTAHGRRKRIVLHAIFKC